MQSFRFAGYLSVGSTAIVVAPLLLAGFINLLVSQKRNPRRRVGSLRAALIAFLILNSDLLKLATPESVRDLVAAADARGYRGPLWSRRN